MRKLKKFFKNPGIFIRDHLNKKYPIIRNEIECAENEEDILMRHDLALESKIDIDFPIDVVFTWVDDTDPAWQLRYQQHKSQVNAEHVGRYATDPARFSNHDELRYSLGSVLKFLPWVRRIYIVTDQQCPKWLTPSDKIRIVDHSDIIDRQYLPTFNSHVIEAHLHKIPDLAEHFIYFNDDVFVARPLPAGHFFRSNGIASLFMSSKSLAIMQKKGTDTPTLSASLKSASILNQDFSFLIDHPLVHTYVPLRKSIFEESWRLYRADLKSFLSHRFRTNHDLNLATFFVPWLSYIRGVAVPSRDICYYFNARSPAAATYFKALEIAKQKGTLPHSFCANDFNSKEKAKDSNVTLLLSRYFKDAITG
ncbi:Stealth CR1 domain-containing protein [Aeromonas hydrophila]|uniref:Stealth CR1 domain-containing protein n=1 Tax=Aeromonas hydrophila TaxID=644 RepID=UPI0021E68A51|nr:Stealth CR1 domain-containing protein [Aeromonas hydrophila]MCV3275266.1 Stealth CR1 domain-containing protein [Aeromonas hydrophila]